MQETTVVNKQGTTRWNPEKIFSDPSTVGAALLQCLIDNDTQTYIEILESCLRMNKLQVAQKAKISRSTVQLAFSKTGKDNCR
jgi:DNA-binding phage protein